MTERNGFHENIAPEPEDPVIREVRQNFDELHRMNAERLHLANAKAIHSIALSLDSLVSIHDVLLEEIQSLVDERKFDDELDD